MARSKEFEESAVLYKAMQLFWEQGYEKTSMNDLVEHMGIHRRSLYDTFGDKRTLFLKAMERYGDIINASVTGGVQRSSTAWQAIHYIFDSVIDRDEDSPPGCMYVNAAVELASRDAEIDAKAGEGFAKTEQLLADLIRKGQEAGEFAADGDAGELAETLHNTLLGLRVLARTSASQEKLRRIANTTLNTQLLPRQQDGAR
ncbi:TetR/AcrR family transcriptional regulator [Paenibacillaceae bacterium]|nr:TetR/AcrR family transcriptional regulator [Paenibacillaceae bacterium]